MTATLDERATTISPAEAGRRLGIKESTLATWRWAKKGPVPTRVGGRVRYTLAPLADWIEEHSQRPRFQP